MITTERPEWQQRAACRGVGPDIFYSTSETDCPPARPLCESCPVSQHCLDYAIGNAEVYGIWASKNVKERRKVSGRRQGERKRSNVAVCGPLAGHDAHLRRGEDPCRHCRWTYNEYKRIKQADYRWRAKHGDDGGGAAA